VAAEAAAKAIASVSSTAGASLVKHLADLGYVDPHDAALRRAVAERGRQVALGAAQESLAAGRLDEGVAALLRLCNEAPAWAPPRRLLATACYQLGRATEAREHLDWLELHAVEHAQLSLLRAAIDLAGRRLDSAEDHALYARHLSELNNAPVAAGPELIVGEVRLRRGDAEGAEAAYRRALELAPGDARALTGLAGVALMRGDDEGAADLALEALEVDMKLALAHYRLGLALARMERWHEARVALETFARLGPRRAVALRRLARIAELQGDGAAVAEYRVRARRVVAERRKLRARSASVN